MNRPFLSASAIWVALSVVFASDAGANDCGPPVGGSEEIVAWAWGSNLQRQLDDGPAIERHTPVQVQNLSGIRAIAGGTVHSLALKKDCTVWAWALTLMASWVTGPPSSAFSRCA